MIKCNSDYNTTMSLDFYSLRLSRRLKKSFSFSVLVRIILQGRRKVEGGMAILVFGGSVNHPIYSKSMC